MKSMRAKLAGIIADKTLKGGDSQRLAKQVAALLMVENMVHETGSLTRDVMQLRADKGCVEATAVSAHELSDEVMRDIRTVLHREYPKAKTFIINTQHDSSIVGGVKITLANEQLDLSVQAKLNTFKRLTALERNNK